MAPKPTPTKTRGSPASKSSRKTVSHNKIAAAFQRARHELEALGREPSCGAVVEDSSLPIPLPPQPDEAGEGAGARDFPPLTDADERELRAFDMCLKYGPCVGPTRLERWRRAERLRLDPPRRVLEILTAHEADSPANESMLSKYPL
ncbi:hypothetical protein AB1Y20_002210 [Prymnesium parvum]|uniref:DNA polymerase delta subunit 4 n=1 Tax=Prymnesium parvum TaxID=97485 RepID=A0AB34J9P9_PRYPA|mmetsp:Transcript_25577/g.38529  ORF Transcript_25577/g.38529 Transcript_25577/m.38529 type:complete len:147 (-) Transcript_25577:121-561(-)